MQQPAPSSSTDTQQAEEEQQQDSQLQPEQQQPQPLVTHGYPLMITYPNGTTGKSKPLTATDVDRQDGHRPMPLMTVANGGVNQHPQPVIAGGQNISQDEPPPPPPPAVNGQEAEPEIEVTESDPYLGRFPPGWRFCPSEEELVVHYLKLKIQGQELPRNRIRELNIYRHHPSTLAERCESSGNKEWYFFTPRDRRYKHGNQPTRKAFGGYWRASSADKLIYSGGRAVGNRKALAFYNGESKNGVKSDWLMQEYRYDDAPRHQQINDDDMMLDECVLCKIYMKEQSNNGERNRNNNNAGQDSGLMNAPDPNNNSARPQPLPEPRPLPPEPQQPISPSQMRAVEQNNFPNDNSAPPHHQQPQTQPPPPSLPDLQQPSSSQMREVQRNNFPNNNFAPHHQQPKQPPPLPLPLLELHQPSSSQMRAIQPKHFPNNNFAPPHPQQPQQPRQPPLLQPLPEQHQPSPSQVMAVGPNNFPNKSSTPHHHQQPQQPPPLSLKELVQQQSWRQTRAVQPKNFSGRRLASIHHQLPQPELHQPLTSQMRAVQPKNFPINNSAPPHHQQPQQPRQPLLLQPLLEQHQSSLSQVMAVGPNFPNNSSTPHHHQQPQQPPPLPLKEVVQPQLRSQMRAVQPNNFSGCHLVSPHQMFQPGRRLMARVGISDAAAAVHTNYCIDAQREFPGDDQFQWSEISEPRSTSGLLEDTINETTAGGDRSHSSVEGANRTQSVYEAANLTHDHNVQGEVASNDGFHQVTEQTNEFRDGSMHQESTTGTTTGNSELFDDGFEDWMKLIFEEN